MNKLSTLARGLLITGLALGGLLAAPAHAADDADIDVDFSDSCTSVEATSSKDISNVVVEYADGTVEKFDGVNSRDWDFSDPDGIARIWVKSGSNASGDGPGYGERFDCTVVQSSGGPAPSNDEPKKKADEPKKDAPKKADEPKKDAPKKADEPKNEAPATSAGSDAEVGAQCVEGGILVTSTKDISNVVLRFENGEDLKIDGLSGTSRTIEIPAGKTVVTVFVKSGDNASGEGPGYGQPVAVDCGVTAPNTVTTPTNGTTPNNGSTPKVDGTTVTNPATSPSDDVLGVEFERSVTAPSAAPAKAANDTSVLGTVLTKAPQVASAALARTGSSPAALTTIALGLVLAGTLLVRRTRRTTLWGV